MKQSLKQILIPIVLILVGVVGFVVSKNVSNNQKNTSEFLYSNPSDTLPQDKLITTWSPLIERLNNVDVCIATNTEPIYVKLFTKQLAPCNKNKNGLIALGCQSSVDRVAIVCGNQYIITEGWLSGPKSYGIFNKFEVKNNVVATGLHNKYPSALISECIYKGDKVLQVNDNAVDGGVIIFNENGVSIGSASGGMVSRPNDLKSDIDFSALTNCVTIY